MSIEDKLNTLNGYIETFVTDTNERLDDLTSSEFDYLCFTSNEPKCRVAINKSTGDNPPAINLEYKVNDGEWLAYTWYGLYGRSILLANTGDKVYFRGDNIAMGSGSTDFNYFSLEGSVGASGNIMSLLDKQCRNKALLSYCFNSIFNNCSTLTSAPRLPATTLDYYCYRRAFKDCTSLTVAPVLPAKKMEDGCYSEMFLGCVSLVVPPVLPAMTLADNCYYHMFEGCVSLTSTPELPATTLKIGSYKGMFQGCTSLTVTPRLNATTLGNMCYMEMFSGCRALAKAYDLNSTSAPQFCYSEMFAYCTSLKTPPVVAATTIQNSCYLGMFRGCTSLETAPALPATTLENYCYKEMFKNCSSLKIKSAGARTYNDTLSITLPATTMMASAYESMFEGCTSLTSAPYLPATTLATDCYKRMLYGCSKLQYVRIGVKDVSSTYATDWLTNTFAAGGVIVCPHDDASTVVPSLWTKVDVANPVVYEDIPTIYSVNTDILQDVSTIAIMSGSKTLYVLGNSSDTKTFTLKLGNRGYDNPDTSRFIIKLGANMSVVSGDSNLIIPTPLEAGKKNICVYVRDAPYNPKCYLYLVAVED